jgi:hypothetical protein
MSIHKGYGKHIKGSYEIMDLFNYFDGDLIDIDVKVDILGPKYANNKFIINHWLTQVKKGQQIGQIPQLVKLIWTILY